MTRQLHLILFEFLTGTKSCIRLFINDEIDFSQLYSQSTLLLQQGISIEFLLADSLADKIEKDPFQLSKMFQLRTLGASFYTVNDQKESLICECDFKRSLVIVYDEEQSTHTIQKSEAMETHQDWFDQVIRTQSEFLTDNNDLLLWGKVEDSRVMTQHTTVMSWESFNADRLEIVNFGAVSKTGQQNIQIFEDTIIILKAANERQVKLRPILVKAVKEVKLNYRLQFYNRSAKRFEDLREEMGSGIYGIIKGAKLKLIWDIPDAEEVNILPFQTTERTGTFEFYVDDHLEISINYSIQNKAILKKLQIKEFPIPVFDQQFIQIKEHFLKGKLFSFEDKQKEAFAFLSEKGLMQQSFLSEITERCHESERNIAERFERTGFKDFYDKNSISQLNKIVKRRVGAHLKEHPKIKEIIEQLKNHYG